MEAASVRSHPFATQGLTKMIDIDNVDGGMNANGANH
jgi:hypothetical protein